MMDTQHTLHRLKVFKTAGQSWCQLVWQRFWQREEGSQLVLMAFVVSVLLGFAGLAVDGSNVYYQSQRMQISADAAAIGGARKLATNATHTEVNSEIEQLAFANSATEVEWNYINNNRGVHVVTTRAFSAYFARIYGHDVFTVTAESEAQFEYVTGAGGLMPFTINCNCDDDLASGPDDGSGDDENDGDDDDSAPAPASTPVVENGTSPTAGTVQLSDNQSSSYGITYLGQTGNTWSYQVNEIGGANLSYWMLNIDTCLNQVVSYTGGASIGTDGSSGLAGVKWGVNGDFSTGTFSFTLDDSYPAGEVSALANSGSEFGTVAIRGPICDGTNTGNGGSGGSGTTSLCLPTLDFETDTAGAALVAGQIIDTEWAAWGVHVTTGSPSSHPAMIFNTGHPTGNDNDLGTANQAFGGPGVGIGGGSGMPGSNSTALGKTLIIAENSNAANPDDNANGGTIIFTFDYSVRIDDVQILDIDNNSAAGTIRAYSDPGGSTLVATGKMLGLGDNSIQTVNVNGLGVRRLEINFPKSGSVASIVSCRTGAESNYSIGSLLWYDTNNNNLQDSGESGIAGVVMELYVSGQTYLIATATTNAGGGYLFNGLPAGNYEVKIADANFASGGLLADVSYSTANSGSDDSLDSDFSSSTRKAAVTLTNADNLTIDGGFRAVESAPVDTGAQSAVIVVNDNKSSQYEVSLVSNVGNTWTYRVREISGRDLTNWSLGIANCLDKVVSSSPTTGFSAGLDGATGFTGAKWAVSNQFSDGNFSFTLDGAYEARSRQALVQSNTSAQLSISGPDCSVPVTADSPIPTATSTPTDSAPAAPADTTPEDSEGETCNCQDGAGFEYGVEYVLHEPEANAPGNVGWLRWEGDNSSATDLAYNINYPEESPVLYIGDWVDGSSGVTNGKPVRDALEQWVGKKVTIPIYDQVTGNGSNTQYRICAFAVFVLHEYDSQDKTMTGTFVRTLIPSSVTDEIGPDFGALDVRYIR